MRPEIIGVYLGIILLVYLGGKSVFTPMRWGLTALLRMGMGAGALALVNLLGQWVHLTMPINPFTSTFVGFLGAPGVLTLFILNSMI